MRKEHYFGYFLTFQSSRALILKRAVEYIAMMQKQIAENQSDIAQLRQQNKELETQIKALDPCRKATPPFAEEEAIRPSVSNIPPYSIGACMIDPSISSSPLLPPPLNTTSLARIGQPTTASAFGLPTSAFSLPSEFNTASHLSTLNPLSPSTEQQPPTDVLRSNILRAVSNPLLNISSILLTNNPIKLNQPISEFDYAPDIHSQILANSLAIQERQLATTAVRF
uniref:BHLH domain-containing protein n=1 Tax=Ascaris lumbricoides TaxID=6252 RepID=A0A0M3IUJ7_ASCLU